MQTRHKVLVVGTGSIGERHTRCFLATGRVDVSLCEIDDAKRRAVAERYGVSRAFASWDEALADGPVAAVIATPAPWHIPMARQALARGAHVLIEKPLSTSLDGAAELQRQADEQRLRVAVAYVNRLHPSLTALRAALHSGQWGRTLQIVAECGQHFPFYRPAYRETYYTRHETGGGAVQDALTHIINAAEWLVGPVDRLTADADHLALPGVEVEDTVHVLTRHGGVMGCFSLNQHQAPNEFTLTVVCERGTARFESHHQRWRWMVDPGAAWHDEPAGTIERDTLFIAQAHQFLDVIEGQAEPRCTLAEATQTLRVNLAILESLRKASWQQP